MKIISVLFLFFFIQCSAQKGLQYFYADKNQPIPKIKHIIEYQLGYEIIKIDTIIRVQYYIPDSLKNKK